VAQNLSPVIALIWIDRRIGDPVGLGVFSAAVMSLNLVLTPLAMLVPLLFKRWVDLDERSRRRDLGRVLRPMAVLCLGFAAVVLLVEKPVVQQVLGSDYVSRGGIFALLALGIWPQTATRLFGVLFSAAGRPGLSVVGELTRVTALAIGLIAFQVQDLTMLACVWVAAEFLSPTASWLLARRGEKRAGRAIV
jgi:O-antigen/teichoic acid export membrane protein